MSRKTVLISYTVLTLGILAAGLATFPRSGAKRGADAIVTCVDEVYARISCRGLKGELRSDCNWSRQLAITACNEKRRATVPGVVDRIRPSSTRALRCLGRSAVALDRVPSS